MILFPESDDDSVIGDTTSCTDNHSVDDFTSSADNWSVECIPESDDDSFIGDVTVTSDAVVNGRSHVPVVEEEVWDKVRHEGVTKRRRETLHLSRPQDYWEDMILLTKGSMISHMPIFLHTRNLQRKHVQTCERRAWQRTGRSKS